MEKVTEPPCPGERLNLQAPSGSSSPNTSHIPEVNSGLQTGLNVRHGHGSDGY